MQKEKPEPEDEVNEAMHLKSRRNQHLKKDGHNMKNVISDSPLQDPPSMHLCIVYPSKHLIKRTLTTPNTVMCEGLIWFGDPALSYSDD